MTIKCIIEQGYISEWDTVLDNSKRIKYAMKIGFEVRMRERFSQLKKYSRSDAFSHDVFHATCSAMFRSIVRSGAFIVQDSRFDKQ